MQVGAAPVSAFLEDFDLELFWSYPSMTVPLILAYTPQINSKSLSQAELWSTNAGNLVLEL